MTASHSLPGRNNTWTVRMGDHRFLIQADSYEHAVCRLEADCITRGIERKGAEFVITGDAMPDQPSVMQIA